MEPKAQSKTASPVTDALIAWGELKVREFSLGRDAEEREWQEEALFYQRRQWLEWKESERRYVQLRPDKRKPRPMPVSNYYANVINANANQLGAQLVRVIATPKDDDPNTRRAADYAEKAKDAIDQESNLRLLNPLLAKHTALWGMGILYDEIDTTSEQQSLDEQEVESNNVVGCIDCGEVNEMEPASEGEAAGQQTEQCPSCGSMNTMGWQRDLPTTVSQYQTGKGKIRTRVVPVFEVYLPRDVQNANLSPLVIYKPRRTISELRRVFGDAAQDVKADDSAMNRNETRMDSLRTLSAYSYAEKGGNETATITVVFSEWDQLPTRLQDAIEDEVGDDAEGVSVGMDDEQGETPDVDEMKKNGLFFIYAQGMLLQWGANQNVDDDTGEVHKPFTFFLWDIDPASVYPKGVGADLVPLQKRLNRIDSLIELGMMTNAAGKWLWPKTQTTKPPSGDPSEVAEYDPIGEGKLKPEFIQPQPFTGQVWQYRAAILQDFQQLGLITGVGQGQSPGAGTAFRTVAYLGAKASEQLNTQRYLWESAHCLHYKKCLAMAKCYWDEPRQVKVAGPNGRLLFEQYSGEDLKGMYELDFVPNSSIPKTQDEKLAMIQQLVMIGLVDVTEPQTRQYLYDIINLEGLNLAGERQFRKAERDLEAVKRGEMPPESPFQDWQIALKITANFTLTEEFEALQPQLQNYVLAYAEYLNEKVTEIQQGMMMQNVMAQTAGAMGGPGGKVPGGGDAGAPPDPNNRQLEKVPGQNTAPSTSEGAAKSQGDDFASSMGA